LYHLSFELKNLENRGKRVEKGGDYSKMLREILEAVKYVPKKVNLLEL